MLLPKTIRSLLNGGAGKAGVEGLRAAINTLEGEMAAHRGELAEIPGRCGEATLADDGVAKIQSLRARENELYAALEVGQAQLARLRDKLEEQIDYRRRDRIEFFQAQNRAAFEKLDKALAVACTANVEARQIYEAAAAELGGHDAARLIEPLHFGGLLLPDSVETWRAYMRTALYPSRQSPVVATPVHVAKSPAVKPNSSLQHAVRLHHEPPPPHQEQRAPFNETARDGERRIRIIRTGYETPSGKQCRYGDVVAVAADIARRVVQNGAAEFVK